MEGVVGLANNLDELWLIGGDFNSFLHSLEKKGGSQRYSSGWSMFNDWINEFNFYDLGFKGPKVTWSRGNVYERLDRARFATTHGYTCIPIMLFSIFQNSSLTISLF